MSKKLKAKKLKRKEILFEIKTFGFVDVFTIRKDGTVGNIIRMVGYDKKENHLHGFIVNPVIGKEHELSHWSKDWVAGNGGVKWYKFTENMKDHKKFKGRF